MQYTPLPNIVLINCMAYETQRFNTTFKRASTIIPILNSINQIPRTDIYFGKIYKKT